MIRKNIKHQRITTTSIILILFILCQIIPSQAFAQENETIDIPDEYYTDNPFQNPIGFLTYLITNPDSMLYYLSHPVEATGYYWAFMKQVFLYQAWEFVADKPYIEVGYNETVTIQIGKKNVMDLENETFKDMNLQVFLHARSFTFEVAEYPGKFNASWRVIFDPDIIELDENRRFAICKTNLTLSLTAPPVASNAMQSGILKVKIRPVSAYGSFWKLPFPMNVLYVLQFGEVGGQVSMPKSEKERSVDILVKVKPYHMADIDTPKNVELRPNEVASVPLTITNLGNYKDTIGFRIVSENPDIVLSNPIDVTLKPGETKDTILGIGVPLNFFDYGTLHEIKIQAYSLDQPNATIGEQTVVLKTQGVYFSELMYPVIFFLLIIVIIVIYIMQRRRKKWMETYCKKPEKPWKIPEEKEFLEQLKQEDKEKYLNTLERMEDEYISSMLWYKDYYNSILKQQTKKKIKTKPAKPKKEKTKKQAKKPKIIEKPVETEEIKKSEVEEPPRIEKLRIVEEKPKPVEIHKKTEAEKTMEKERLRREKILKKIKIKQQKQRRKLKQLVE